MGATTTEGTGLGSVENIFPRINPQIIRAKDIVDLNEFVRETPPERIDGGDISAMIQSLGEIDLKDKISRLNEQDLKVIILAAEIIKKMLDN